MFNQAGTSLRYSNNKILGGIIMGDYNTHKTIFCGPDPADADRVLIRKVIQSSDKVWAFEETTVTPSENEGAPPTVHTTVSRLGNLDLNENADDDELLMRLRFRPAPNVVGFSLFARAYQNSKTSSFTIVENSMDKDSSYRWAEWFSDWRDRRDISSYLKLRWNLH